MVIALNDLKLKLLKDAYNNYLAIPRSNVIVKQVIIKSNLEFIKSIILILSSGKKK